MLILTRRLNETLMIGEDIQVTVMGMHGNQVRLGIVAPRNIQVDREEVFLRKQQEQVSRDVPSTIVKTRRRRHGSPQAD